MWDLDEFRRKSEGTSWYKGEGLGHFPERFALTITTGGDSLAIWDLNASPVSQWMVFELDVAGNIIISSDLSDVVFLDGCIYIACKDAATKNRVTRIDFVQDKTHLFTAGGVYQYKSSIEARNDAAAFLFLNASPAIVNDIVNAVSVIRDPEGSVDEFGRPKQIVAAGTAGGVSVSDAGITAFYDGTATAVTGVSLYPNGDMLVTYDSAADHVEWRYKVQTITADVWFADEAWRNDELGSEDLPWANGAVFNDIVAIPNASVSKTGSPIVAFGSGSGLAISHANRELNSWGLTWLIDNTVNSPPWSSTVVDVWGLHDANGEFGKNWTAIDVPTYGEGVIGNCVTFAGDDALEIDNDAAFNLGTNDWAISLWVKSAAAANPGSNVFLVDLVDNDAGPTDIVQCKYDTDGGFDLYVSDDGGVSDDVASFAQDVYDTNWHHAVFQRNGSTWEIYCDGEQVATAAVSDAAASLDPQDAAVGCRFAEDNFFSGSIDQLTLIKGRALTANEIRMLYQRDLKAKELQDAGISQVFGNADIDYVQVDEQSGLIICGDEDSTYVIDAKLGVILKHMATPSGDGDDAAVFAIPGSDSTGYIQAQTTGLTISQPDPKAISAGNVPQKEIVAPRARIGHFFGPSNLHVFDAVVDSAGNGDYTQVDDAIDAGAMSIFVKNGTYSAFTADVAGLRIVGESWAVIIDGGITSHAITASGNNVHISNLSVKTTGGGGQNYNGVHATGDNQEFIQIRAIDADLIGFDLNNNENLMMGCLVSDSDNQNVDINGARHRLVGNHVVGPSHGIYVNGGANLMITGNLSETNILINAGDNSVVTGNITNTGITDTPGTSTVSGNEQY